MEMTKIAIIEKPELQRILRDIRSNGYETTKIKGGYEVIDAGVLLLKAMVGRNDYLVRWVEGFLTQPEPAPIHIKTWH